MAEHAAPWIHVGEPPGDGFGSWTELRGLPPGVAAAARRAEAIERAAEQREAAERRERVETRREMWAYRRMQEMSWRGEPFDPRDWRTLAQSPEAMAAEYFARQDAEDRANERKALVAAGLLHLLPNVTAADVARDEIVLEDRETVETRRADTELVRAHRRTVLEGIRARARHGLKRTGRPS